MSDSESAPEDVSFQQAKDDAFGSMQGAAQAVRELKEKKKEARKRKLDFLRDQKAKKLARMKELESKKLPESLLSSIDSTTAPVSEVKSVVVKEPENTVKTFHSDEEEESDQEVGDEARYEEVGSTQFSIVTSQDLGKFRNSTAWNFKQQMLFGDRVRREDHAKKGVQKLKQQASCPSLKRPVKT